MPTAFAQDKMNVVVVAGDTDSLPFSTFEPLHEPEAVQDVALPEVHDNIVD